MRPIVRIWSQLEVSKFALFLASSWPRGQQLAGAPLENRPGYVWKSSEHVDKSTKSTRAAVIDDYE